MRHLALLVFSGAALLAGAASAATDNPAAKPMEGGKSYYWWLHPKLGMVKVDRATNAMLVSGHDTGEKSRSAASEK